MNKIIIFAVIVISLVIPLRAHASISTNNNNNPSGTVTIIGGFKIDQKDHGNPVVLIASMLGVTPEVFRSALNDKNIDNHAKLSKNKIEKNKTELLKTLSPYGVTKEKLNEVLNYYRYGKPETWPKSEAKGMAIIQNNRVVGVKITNSGFGYTSRPTVLVKYKNTTLKAYASVLLTKDFKTNGSISSITLIK